MRSSLPSRRVVAALLLGLTVLFASMLLGLASSARAATEIQLGTITPSFPEGEPQQPKITAKAAILMDMDSGRVLFSHAANNRLPMASTTKIMTGVLALESLELTDRVTISANVPSTYGSMLGFKAGEVLTVEELLYALLVPSANDAAVALAEATAGSVPAFVQRMNRKAEDLGLTNTHFSNPSGLNAPRHFSSAKDMATLTAYAMQDPIFRRIVNTEKYTFLRPGENGETTVRKSENHNLLLSKYGWVTGVKTGQTPYAKFCLVASGTKDGVNLVAVVLGAKDDITRQKEAKALLLYGFALYPRTTLADRAETMLNLDAADVLGRQIRLIPEAALIVRLFKTDKVTALARLERDGLLPVQAGDAFGDMEFTVNGKSLGSVKLLAADSMERAGIKMILNQWRDCWPPRLALGEYLEVASASELLPQGTTVHE